MSGIDPAPTNGIRYWIDNHEKRISRLESHEPAVMLRRLDDQEKDISSLVDDFRGVKRALYAFSFTVAGSAVGTIIALVATR